MKKLNVLGLVGVVLLLSGCPGGGVGVCTGYSSTYGSTYCKDGWTAAECAEWNTLGVNGVTWYFYPGQTCAERGTPATP